MNKTQKRALVAVIFVVIGVTGGVIVAVVPWNWMIEPLSLSTGLTGVGQSWAYVKQGGIDGDMLVSGNLTLRFVAPQGICSPPFTSGLWVMTESQFQGWSSSSPMNAPKASQDVYFSLEVLQHYYNQTGLGGCFPEIDSTWPISFHATQSTYYFVIQSGSSQSYPATLSLQVHSEPLWFKVLVGVIFGFVAAAPPIRSARKRRRSRVRKRNGSGKKGSAVTAQPAGASQLR